MSCVLSVLISLFELSCMQRDLLCLVRIISAATEQILIMQQAIQNSTFCYMATLITIDDLALFSQGERISSSIKEF